MHFYQDTKLLYQTGAHCTVCNKACEGASEPVDLFMMGFPCKLHSVMNPGRWTDAQILKKEACRPLQDCFKFLKRNVPSVAILENVIGLLKKGKRQDINMVHGDFVERQLEQLESFFFIRIVLDAASSGLPHLRERVLYVLVNKALPDALATVQRIERNMHIIAQKPFRVGHIADFLDRNPNDERPAMYLPSAKRAKRNESLPMLHSQHSIAYRKKHGLPARNAAGGKPFSENATKEQHT